MRLNGSLQNELLCATNAQIEVEESDPRWSCGHLFPENRLFHGCQRSICGSRSTKPKSPRLLGGVCWGARAFLCGTQYRLQPETTKVLKFYGRFLVNSTYALGWSAACDQHTIDPRSEQESITLQGLASTFHLEPQISSYQGQFTNNNFMLFTGCLWHIGLHGLCPRRRGNCTVYWLWQPDLFTSAWDIHHQNHKSALAAEGFVPGSA